MDYAEKAAQYLENAVTALDNRCYGAVYLWLELAFEAAHKALNPGEVETPF